MTARRRSATPAPRPFAPRDTTPMLVRVGVPAVLVALIASLALGAVAARFHQYAGFSFAAWLLVMGGIAVSACWTVLTAAIPGRRRTAFDHARDRAPEPATRIAEVTAIEAAILEAEWTRSGFAHELRPILRRIAAARLAEKYQVGIESEPAAAREICGEELWTLIGATPGEAGIGVASEPADGRRGTERRGKGETRAGISRARVERAIELLEAL